MLTKKKTRAEFRNFKRVPFACLVKYREPGKKEYQVTNARNVGAGGLDFWSETPLAKGTVLEMSFFLPSLARTVETPAQVLRSTKGERGSVYYISVNFLDLPTADREAVNQFAETLSAR